MKISGLNFLVTGAAGGIGGEIARALAGQGARVVLLGRNSAALDALAYELRSRGAEAQVLVGDLATAEIRALAASAIAAFGTLDGVVNCAGVQYFGMTRNEDEAEVAHLMAVNVVAPIRLTQALLPHFESRPRAHVVNIGSIFGSIGYPCFASYSASKFAMRGYSEALRRELAHTSVQVHYVAPRCTRTAFNKGSVARMAEQLRMNQDSPEEVAAHVVDAISSGQADAYLGWPERLFVRINALLPRLVDGPLVREARKMRAFVRSA